jgi:hypothetical protein
MVSLYFLSQEGAGGRQATARRTGGAAPAPWAGKVPEVTTGRSDFSTVSDAPPHALAKALIAMA